VQHPRTTITTSILALWLLIVGTAAATAAPTTGKVVGVADGDTITLLLPGNHREKVRLEGIDCPEKRQAFGTCAKQFTSDLVFGKRVSIKRYNTDRYGFLMSPFFPCKFNIDLKMSIFSEKQRSAQIDIMKPSLVQTHPKLRSEQGRQAILFREVISSSRIEGITCAKKVLRNMFPSGASVKKPLIKKSTHKLKV